MHRLSVEVERGSVQNLRPGRQAHHRVVLVIALHPVFVEVAGRIEHAVDARGEHDALADLEGVDLAAADGQRALRRRALKRGGRGKDEQELVHCVGACGCKQKSTGLPQGGARQQL